MAGCQFVPSRKPFCKVLASFELLSPMVVYFVINAIAGQAQAFSAVGAMLMGVIVTGLFVAISMTAGPAVNPMIKITNIVALLLLAVLAGH